MAINNQRFLKAVAFNANGIFGQYFELSKQFGANG
jgi:hypothetical protein